MEKTENITEHYWTLEVRFPHLAPPHRQDYWSPAYPMMGTEPRFDTEEEAREYAVEQQRTNVYRPEYRLVENTKRIVEL